MLIRLATSRFFGVMAGALAILSILPSLTLNLRKALPIDATQQWLDSFETGKTDDAKLKIDEALVGPDREFARLYNLGNVAVKNSRLGEALGFYYMAQKINPHDRDLVNNIRFIEGNSGIKPFGRSTPLTVFRQRVLARLNLNDVLCLFVLASILFLIVMRGAIRKRNARLMNDGDGSFRMSVDLAAGIFGLFVALVLIGFKTWDLTDTQAIVVEKKIEMRSGPSETNAALSEVPEGAIVSVEMAGTGWYQVTTSQGTTGWVKDKDLIVFGSGSIF